MINILLIAVVAAPFIMLIGYTIFAYKQEMKRLGD